MMAALRHFLRFIDLEKGFEAHGFNRKVGRFADQTIRSYVDAIRKMGAAFKLNRENREGCTLPANSQTVFSSPCDRYRFRLP